VRERTETDSGKQEFRRCMVPLAGLEPARCFHHLILSQARLPIPPQGLVRDHSGEVQRVNGPHTITAVASLYGWRVSRGNVGWMRARLSGMHPRLRAMWNAQAANSVCSLPRVRGRGGEGVCLRAASCCMPPPYPSSRSRIRLRPIKSGRTRVNRVRCKRGRERTERAAS
jgi:hypothetical protein